MFQVQRVQSTSSSQPTWTVIGEDYFPVEPIDSFLSFLRATKRPNTIRTYAHALKLYWEFLDDSALVWQDIQIDALSSFIHWLRLSHPRVVSLRIEQAKRSDRTINLLLAAVRSFYDFHSQIGNLEGRISFYEERFLKQRSYKPLLHHISRGKAVKVARIRLKEAKRFPGVLSPSDVHQLIDACNLRRDKFLLSLLYESGMRIGEALGLRHEDIHSFGENEINVCWRADNANGAYSKSSSPRTIHVSKDLMGLYAEYLINEYPDTLDSDYVFVNLKGDVGKPLKYASINSLFKRLVCKTGIQVYPHLFRHTHATDLIENNWDLAKVQKRLGHASVQTTVDTYAHVSAEHMKLAYQNYTLARSGGREVE
jgi:integrase/recombinase XerD